MDKAKSKLARSTVWWTRNKACNCAYTYGEDISVKAQEDEEFRQTMEDLIQCVFSKFPSLPLDAWPNCANLNLYSEGTEGVGWHADDELIFMGTQRDCPILSLSLGGMREFWIALQSEGVPDVKQGLVEVDLQDGDLMTMEGLIQKHCMHQVPRASPADASRQELRINVTFRWMRLHKPKCPYAKVAQTWNMLAQAASPGRQGAGDKEQESSQKSTSRSRCGIQVLDPLTQLPIKLDEPSSTSSRPQRRRERNLTAVMSPVPESARALFGEGARKFLQPPPRPTFNGGFLQSWATRAVKWQPCDSCGHTCWGGGRLCQEGEGAFLDHWFCRCCWLLWSEDQNASCLYQYEICGYLDDASFSSWIG